MMVSESVWKADKSGRHTRESYEAIKFRDGEQMSKARGQETEG